ncbi:MAG TPA: hypothetical protein VFT22_30440 [Kofleriaceae bacterium]|nr:hypothetical protein [Kofleriaceae bacterium]
MSAGQIHDLGYKRYAGSRRSADTRWIVIMRHQLTTAWRTWWRFKVWLVAAVVATGISSAFLYLASGKLFRMIGGAGGAAVRFADGILPLSTVWYCKIGFVVSLTVSATVVAGDLQSGAFTFYFARSVATRDYVLGKLAGLVILLSLIMLMGPLLLALLRFGLSDDLDQVSALVPIVPKALAVGALGTLIYAVVPFGFSALATSRGYAIAMWAAYDILIGGLAEQVGRMGAPAIGALDLPSALQAISFDLFDLRLLGPRDLAIPTSAALISIFAHAALAIAVVSWRVRRAQETGVGASS